jgi:uncharacterized repeat protein (TIGR04076 family)
MSEHSFSGGGNEVTSLYDLRVTVDHIDGRSTCGLQRGDYFELTESSRVRIPEGKHFCVFALAAIIPLLIAKERKLGAGDWLEQETMVACPDPEERLVMRIERTRRRRIPTAELT